MPNSKTAKTVAIFSLALFFCLCFTVNGIAATPTFPGGLIIDHNAARDFDHIPLYWLNAARQLTLHYAHTSHGSQIITGAEALELADETYNIDISYGKPPTLPHDNTALRIYDGNGEDDNYITPDLYWDGNIGMNMTRKVADTALFDFSMWSWCGQQSYNDTETVNRYLANLNRLESEYPNMRFIYMTGHTDGTNTPYMPGTLKYNNKRVRQYAINYDKIVFDFADIESWDPAGAYYPRTGDPDGACNWCDTWCAKHPSDCADVTTGDCAHSHPYICKLKARAFWYMMARLAGWAGPSRKITANALGTGAGSVVSEPAGINYTYPAIRTDSGIYKNASAVKVTANANAGSRASWKGTCKAAGGSETGNNTLTAVCSIKVTKAATVTVTFERYYTITANARGIGAGSVVSAPAGISYKYPAVKTDSGMYKKASTLALTAKANTGSSASWSGTCEAADGTETGNNTRTAVCTIKVTKTAVITATFKK